MKTCTRCKAEKPLDQFAKTETRCRDCNRERAREYRDKHPDRVKASQAKYAKTDKAKVRTKRWLDAGGSEYQAEWQQQNRDRCAAASRRWYYRNLDAERVRYTNNNNRRRDLTRGFVSDKDMRRLLAECCAECGAAGEHIDHIIPISRGGRHSIGNLQMLCAKCNLSKHNKTMIEWRYRRRKVA